MATTILLIVHFFVTLALIGVVLIQRSEGGGLGIGSSQGMGGFMSGRGTANLLTRTTAILATVFMGLSLALALLNRGTTVNSGSSSILDVPPGTTRPATPVPVPAPPPAAHGAASPAVVAPLAPAAPPVSAPAPAVPAPAATAPATPSTLPAPAAPAPATPPTQR